MSNQTNDCQLKVGDIVKINPSRYPNLPYVLRGPATVVRFFGGSTGSDPTDLFWIRFSAQRTPQHLFVFRDEVLPIGGEEPTDEPGAEAGVTTFGDRWRDRSTGPFSAIWYVGFAFAIMYGWIVFAICRAISLYLHSC